MNVPQGANLFLGNARYKVVTVTAPCSELVPRLKLSIYRRKTFSRSNTFNAAELGMFDVAPEVRSLANQLSHNLKFIALGELQLNPYSPTLNSRNSQARWHTQRSVRKCLVIKVPPWVARNPPC